MHADLIEYTESAVRIGKYEATRLDARAARVCDKVAEGRDGQLMRMSCLGGQLGWFERLARVSRRAWPAAVQLGSTRVERASKIGAEI